MKFLNYMKLYTPSQICGLIYKLSTSKASGLKLMTFLSAY